MPDAMSLYAQLGAPPPRSAQAVPTADCHQLFDWDTGHIHPALVPRITSRGRDNEASSEAVQPIGNE